MYAYRRRSLKVPLPGIALPEWLVGEDACGTYLDEIAAEFAFEDAVPVTPETDMVV